ncbi:ABC transporter permease/substrate-binding protein [Croceicoccus marinus]|uniref:ABC transporter permease n=1 Tax=Croceicoccus marinus TaxID=450378 RepID=A0A1Z1FED9_9SPHN|nr:ABC transporter permease/substrate-binding protein [Croceicoccus marinus]ARU17073.1 ABC transporter permease [Croceicoccus marinus]
MNPLQSALSQLPGLLQAHVGLSLAALALALLIGVPLALLAAGRARLGSVILSATSIVQTVPGLALLALFYPALLLLGRATGLAIPALGFLPAVAALTLYAMLPILRNGVAGIEQVDPAALEVADSLGMTRRQRLRFVELPLAAPVMLAGIRTAAVWTFGTATLATTVGQPSLGNLIFAGLQTEDWTLVLVGCIAAAAVALLVDALLALAASGLARRAAWRLWSAAAGMAGIAALALVPLDAGSDRPVITVGAKNFSEQYILASLIEARLQRAGFATERRDNLGSTIAYRALASGDIDVYVDYSGTLWSNILQREDTPEREAMLDALRTQLAARDGVTLLAPLGFENAYAFAVRKEAGAPATLDDLAARSPALDLGTDLEFTDRPEWDAVKALYPMRFASITQYSPTFMYRAIADGTVDAITAFSSDGRIAALDLQVLQDPRGALPRYDAVVLLSPSASADPRVTRALRGLDEAISIQAMRQANLMVDRADDKASPAQAAAWLEGQIAPPAN